MPQRILVCDDEPHIVRAISLKFTRAGFDVMGVSDAAACWRQLHYNPLPALLFVDDSMPSGGCDLVRRIREDDRLSNLPIILMTTTDVDSIERENLQIVFDIIHVVAKPFSPRELLALVCNLLDHRPDSSLGSTGSAIDRPHIAQSRARATV